MKDAIDNYLLAIDMPKPTALYVVQFMNLIGRFIMVYRKQNIMICPHMG